MVVEKKEKKRDRDDAAIERLSEDLVMEVLARVEKIKALYQYKCVSKAWRLIIEGPHFLEAYRSHHCRCRGLLLSIVKRMGVHSDFRRFPKPNRPFQVDFFFSTIVAEKTEPFFPLSTVTLSHEYIGITKVVNGLVCLYEFTRVFVCNVCTGETVRLPDNQILGSHVFRWFCPLGYDPTSKVYKLLKINAIPLQSQSPQPPRVPFPNNNNIPYYHRLECEILALGHDSSWRRLGSAGAPPVRRGFLGWQCLYAQEPVLINGIMYWVLERNLSPTLVSFDVNKEEFRSIKPPPSYDDRIENCVRGFALVGGRPALYCYDTTRHGHSHDSLIYFTLNDEEGNSWRRYVAALPHDFEDFATPVGNLPTGETLFGQVFRNRYFDLPATKGLRLDDGFPVLHCYDHGKNKFEKLLVGGQISQSALGDDSDSDFTTVNVRGSVQEENIAPLKVLLSSNINFCCSSM